VIGKRIHDEYTAPPYGENSQGGDLAANLAP